MRTIFADFDVEHFWEPSEYALREYVGAPLTDEAVATVERQLGYKLPASYVELMRFQNGGIPRRTNHRTKERTSWADDHIAITGIYSIGSDRRCSLCGEVGSRFWGRNGATRTSASTSLTARPPGTTWSVWTTASCGPFRGAGGGLVHDRPGVVPDYANGS